MADYISASAPPTNPSICFHSFGKRYVFSRAAILRGRLCKLGMARSLRHQPSVIGRPLLAAVPHLLFKGRNNFL
jgi:hypothetical protein